MPQQMRTKFVTQTLRVVYKDIKPTRRCFASSGRPLHSYSVRPSGGATSASLLCITSCSRAKYPLDLAPRAFQSTMPKSKVLLLGKIDHAHDAWKSLSSIAETVEPKSNNRADFIQECKSGSLDGVVAAYRTFDSVATTGLWDEELASALPKSLRFVAHNGAGYDQLYTQALAKRDPPIIATNVPTAVNDATADTAIFLLLGALRNFNTSILALRRGDWRGNPPPAVGNDPQGKTLGILGMGGIGRNFAEKARAFGMKVLYHNRRRLDSVEMEGGAKYVSFEELLRTSDVVSVHVPLNAKTKHLLGEKELGMCKDGVVIVNTARGAVIDEDALVKKIQEGKVGSVGLDVYEEEPKVHPGLVDNDRVLLLPHMGTWTYETQKKMEEWSIGNVSAAVEWSAKGDRKSAESMSVVPEHSEIWQKELKE